MTCSQCGHDHPTRADREACDAIEGRVRAYAPGGPDVLCGLCGYVGDWSAVLDHFGLIHRGEPIDSGRLVRPIRSVQTRGEL